MKLVYLFLISLFFAISTFAQVPETMHFQGYLTDPGSGDPKADGNYSIVFSIYDVETSGTALWTETQATVAVAGGYFSVILGSVTPLTVDFDVQYYLDVAVEGETMSPRYALASSAYAFTAKNVEGITVDANGSIGIGTESPSVELEIVREGKAEARLTSYTDFGGSELYLERSFGSISAPINVESGNTLGALRFRGYGATAYGTGAIVFGKARGTWTDSSHPGILTFNTTPENSTAPVERIRITEDGFVGIGVTSPASPLNVVTDFDGYNSWVARFTNSGDPGQGIVIRVGEATPSSSTFYALFQDGNGVQDGGITGNGSGGINYNTTSDRRLKQNIAAFDESLDLLSKMKVSSYEYKKVSGKKQIGFIAQELYDVFPQAVSGDPTGDVESEPMMVDYSKLTPLLTGGIQELLKRVQYLEEENEFLRETNERLHSQIGSFEDRLQHIESSLAEKKSKAVETVFVGEN